MVMMECGDEHWVGNEGWPQPGEREKGNGGLEVKGGHRDLVSDCWFEQV